MSLTKITDTDISTYGVISAADKLTGTAAQNKAVFDNLISNAVKTKFNALIDALEATSSTTGASQIGASVTGVEGSNIQALLSAYKTLLDACVATTSQSLTEQQKATARDNIGVSGSQVAVNSVNGRTGAITLDPTDVGLSGVKQKKISVSLPSASWSGSSSPFSIDITAQITEVTSYTKIDLVADNTVLGVMDSDGVSALYVENNAGTVTAYARSSKPTTDLTVQAMQYEVTV